MFPHLFVKSNPIPYHSIPYPFHSKPAFIPISSWCFVIADPGLRTRPYANGTKLMMLLLPLLHWKKLQKQDLKCNRKFSVQMRFSIGLSSPVSVDFAWKVDIFFRAGCSFVSLNFFQCCCCCFGSVLFSLCPSATSSHLALTAFELPSLVVVVVL